MRTAGVVECKLVGVVGRGRLALGVLALGMLEMEFVTSSRSRAGLARVD